LARGKIGAADAEFTRAKNLDAGDLPAYVGMALLQGHREDVDGRFEILNQARGLADTPNEAEIVDRGYERLQGMRSTVRR